MLDTKGPMLYEDANKIGVGMVGLNIPLDIL